jgi:nucleoid-associated protein YgaU
MFQPASCSGSEEVREPTQPHPAQAAAGAAENPPAAAAVPAAAAAAAGSGWQGGGSAAPHAVHTHAASGRGGAAGASESKRLFHFFLHFLNRNCFDLLQLRRANQ